MVGGRTVLVEALKEVKLFFRYKEVYAIGSVSFILIVLSFILGMAWYVTGVRLSQTVVEATMWGFVTFIIFADVIWIAPRVVAAMQEKILEYVIAARGSVIHYIVGSTTRALIELSIDLPLVLLVFYALFGVLPTIASPLLFVVSIALILSSSVAIASITAILTMSSRNPWIAPNIAQWLIPLSGGMIPPLLLPRDVVDVMRFSPFYYIVSPLVYSAVGTWIHPPLYTLSIGFIEAAALWITALVLERRAVRMARERGAFEVW